MISHFVKGGQKHKSHRIIFVIRASSCTKGIYAVIMIYIIPTDDADDLGKKKKGGGRTITVHANLINQFAINAA